MQRGETNIGTYEFYESSYMFHGFLKGIMGTRFNGTPVNVNLEGGKYVRLERNWQKGDKVTLNVPMTLSQSVWHVNQGSRSINYGPLTFSLKIKENYEQVNSIETAIWDSKWQKKADPSKWPTYEIYPGSDWNYGLVIDDKVPLIENFEIVKKDWPTDNFPFTVNSVPLEIKAHGRKIIGWDFDRHGLTGELPIRENLRFEPHTENITLIPMGAARLRISAFPVYNP